MSSKNYVHGGNFLLHFNVNFTINFSIFLVVLGIYVNIINGFA